MSKVAVIRSRYLPYSETFIYSELVNLTNITPIVCTQRKMNLERFPFKPIFLYKKQQDLQRILKKQKVDLIHARFGITGADILHTKKVLGLPMLSSFHGFDLPSNRKTYQRYKGKLARLFEEGEAFTVASHDMKKVLEKYGCPAEKIFVHHSGIDVTQFAFKKRTLPKDKCITLLSVGRLVEKKGMKYLIDSFSRVKKKYPNVRLRIAGDGPLRSKLIIQVKRLNLREQITFLGEISHNEVVKEMQLAHLFVLASTKDSSGNQEGIPNVLKEAMACGLPVVSTSHAGIPELVSHGESGYLVNEKDTKALARCILKLIDSSDQWGKMGEFGRMTVNKFFDSKKQILELEEIYHNILKQRSQVEK